MKQNTIANLNKRCGGGFDKSHSVNDLIHRTKYEMDGATPQEARQTIIADYAAAHTVPNADTCYPNPSI